MAFWSRKTTAQTPDPEGRASIENPDVPISSQAVVELFGMDGISASGVNVTTDSALGVPAVWAAVNFISGTIAGLPLHVYRKTSGGRKRVNGGLEKILHDAVNEEMSSFEWRKYSFERVLTGGRAVSFIERNASGAVINLWPLVPKHIKVKRRNGRKIYEYQEGGSGRTTIYESGDVLDIPFMLHEDMLASRSPLMDNKDTIGLAIAATQYGSRLFSNGGVPPFAITGPFQTPEGMKRASHDLHEAVRKAKQENRLALSLPAGHEIKPIGVDPEKAQLVELKKFLIEEVARIYSLPPTFLQDLSRATFSNTEQQDLHLVKHTIRRWVEQVEQEMNLKLFGRRGSNRYVEFNLDGLLRGDFKTRMDGYATGIQNAVLTPNEARRQENRPDDPLGGALMIQGATVPLGAQPNQQPEEPAGDPDDEA